QSTRCHDERPALRELAPGHRVACHWAEDVRDGKIQPHEVEPVETESFDGVTIPTFLEEGAHIGVMRPGE
ncbi:MAG: hypothetical protein ACRDT8_20660, partial [Micromonosporaceae bacterium]